MRLTDLSSFRARMIGAVILITLMCGVPFPVGAQTVQTVSKLTIVDTNGTEVGPVFGTFPPTVVFQIAGRLVTVMADSGRFFGNTVFFTSPDCMGTPFVGPVNSLLPLAAVGIPRATLYLADPTASFQSQVVKSGVNNSSGVCANQPDQTISVIRAVPIIDLFTVFTPPFSGRPTPAPPVTAQIFDDVPPSHPFFTFIQALAAEGITIGCSVSPPLYCPDAALTRGQAAVLFGKGLNLVP